MRASASMPVFVVELRQYSHSAARKHSLSLKGGNCFFQLCATQLHHQRTCFKIPVFLWLNLSHILSWISCRVSESNRAVFTHQLMISMNYEQLKVADYPVQRVTTPLWCGVESLFCWEPFSLAAGWQTSMFPPPTVPIVLGKAFRPEDFDCIAI